MVKFLYLGLLVPLVPLAATALSRQEKLLERYHRLETGLTQLRSDFTRLKKASQKTNGRLVDIANIAEGRLTLETATPFSTSNQANKSTLYYTPYRGNNVALYSGTAWSVRTFSEVSLALAGLTTNRNYDVFLYDNSGTLALELAIWTNNTTRASALTLQDGVYVRGTNTTRRYLGSIRATSATQTQDTESQRFVWNYQNRAQRHFYVNDATDSWTYTTNGWRAARASTTNRVEILLGLGEVLVEAKVLGVITNGTGTLNYYASGIGLDTTANNSASIRGSGSNNTMINQVWGDYVDYPGQGYHYLQWVERSAGTAVTVFGDNGDATQFRSGLLGEFSA